MRAVCNTQGGLVVAPSAIRYALVVLFSVEDPEPCLCKLQSLLMDRWSISRLAAVFYPPRTKSRVVIHSVSSS